MSFLGNLVWIIFGGFIAAVGYFIGGLLLCLTIIGIPFGVKAIELSGQILAPFGRQIVTLPRGSGCFALLFNIVWLFVFGWEIALVHLVSGVVLTITIIGIPFANQHFKLIPVALFPFTYKLQ